MAFIGNEFSFKCYDDELMPALPLKGCLNKRVILPVSIPASDSDSDDESGSAILIELACRQLFCEAEKSSTNLAYLARKGIRDNPHLPDEEAIKRLVNMYNAGYLRASTSVLEEVVGKVRFEEHALRFSCDRNEPVDQIVKKTAQDRPKTMDDRGINGGLGVPPPDVSQTASFERLIEYVAENYVITEIHVCEAFLKRLQVGRDPIRSCLEKPFVDALYEVVEAMKEGVVELPIERLKELCLEKFAASYSEEADEESKGILVMATTSFLGLEIDSEASNPKVAAKKLIDNIFEEEFTFLVLDRFFEQQGS